MKNLIDYEARVSTIELGWTLSDGSTFFGTYEAALQREKEIEKGT